MTNLQLRRSFLHLFRQENFFFIMVIAVTNFRASLMDDNSRIKPKSGCDFFARFSRFSALSVMGIFVQLGFVLLTRN